MTIAKTFLPFVFGSLLACAGIGRPSITPQQPQIAGVDRQGLLLDMELQVDNPNPFSLVAQKVTGTLSLGAKNKRVGTASAEMDRPIAAKSSAAVQSKLEVAWSGASALGEFLLESEVPFTFDGEVAFSGGPVSVQVPFTLRGRLTREQLAQAGAAGLSGLLSR